MDTRFTMIQAGDIQNCTSAIMALEAMLSDPIPTKKDHLLAVPLVSPSRGNTTVFAVSILTLIHILENLKNIAFHFIKMFYYVLYIS